MHLLSSDQHDASHHRSELPVLFALGAFAVGQAIQVNNGLIHHAALAWLTVAVIAFVAGMRGKLQRLKRLPLDRVLLILVTIQWVELLVSGVRWGPAGAAATTCFFISMAVTGAGLLMLALRRARLPHALALLIIGHFIAGALTIRTSPTMNNDVWHFQQDAAAALLNGHSPYSVRYRDIYWPSTGLYGDGVSVDGWLTVSFPYPPLTLLLAAPARLFGDIRWSHLLSLELATILLAAAVPGRRAALAAALLLLNPRTFLVIKFGWTEPMVVLTFAAVIYCAMRRPQWLWIALGLLLAIKQYSILMLPFVPMLLPQPASWRETLRLLSRAGAVAAAVTLPFFLWDPSGFFRSVVLFQFQQPFRPDALSYVVLLWHMTGIKAGALPGFSAALIAMAMAWRGSPRNISGFAASVALVLVAFFALNKQAFCNYYFLVAAIACCVPAVIGQRHVVATEPAVRPGDIAPEAARAKAHAPTLVA